MGTGSLYQAGRGPDTASGPSALALQVRRLVPTNLPLYTRLGREHCGAAPCPSGRYKPVDTRAAAVNPAGVTSRISHTSIDATDAYAQSVFWAKVLGFAENPDDPNLPGHAECPIFSPDDSQILLFLAVPDGPKRLKNRLHLDLQPVDRTREEEAERLAALGATQVADHRRPDGGGWITMADPEGNEFCILPHDRPAFTPSE